MATDLCFALNREEVSYNQFDDEIIAIHLDSGTYFSLRGCGAVIWSKLAEGHASASSLATLFRGSAEDARAQILAFLQELAELRLLTASNEALPSPPATASALEFAPPKVEVFHDLEGLLQADPIHEVSEEGWPAPPIVSKAA
jgi:hypothetical protein